MAIMTIKMRKNALFLLTVVVLIILSAVALAAENESIPIGLQKILEYNQENTQMISTKVSFVIAFIAGMMGILSPCILPFVPAYFSYTFKEKKDITKMTLVFFAGFSIVFVILGIIAGFLGQQTLVYVQLPWLVQIAGVFLMIMGLMTIFGKGFSSFIKIRQKPTHDIPGVFLFGIAFALGWTACLGPILAGILGIGAILGDPVNSGFLLFFYALGNLTPLFLLSVFYDSLKLHQSKILQGKLMSFMIDDTKYYVHSTNLVSGLLFMVIGVVLLIFKGTAVVNTWDILKTKDYFYATQNALINSPHAWLMGTIVFIIFLVVMVWFFWKGRK